MNTETSQPGPEQPDPPPHQLNYGAGRKNAVRERRAAGRFFLGLIGGFLFSFFYLILSSAGGGRGGSSIVMLIAMKIGVAICLMLSKRSRPAGIGFIVSIPLAILLIIGICSGAFHR